MRLSVLSLLALSACVIQPVQPAAPQMTPITHPLPQPVWPDECVANWYAKTALPPCVESWITEINKEQQAIVRSHKKKRHKVAVLSKR